MAQLKLPTIKKVSAMNRRNFLGFLVGGLATAAAVRTFPFRVFSFPKEIKLANAADYGVFWEDWQGWGVGNSAPFFLHGIPYWADVPPSVGTFSRIARRVTPAESLG